MHMVEAFSGGHYMYTGGSGWWWCLGSPLVLTGVGQAHLGPRVRL